MMLHLAYDEVMHDVHNVCMMHSLYKVAWFKVAVSI